MKLLFINASHKEDAQSDKVAHVLSSMCIGKFDQTKTYKLKDLNIPFWDEGVWGMTDVWKKTLDPIFKDIDQADAFVFVVPEYNGMVPPHLKNYFLICNAKIMAHKPALIVSVSASGGGAYPIMELRTSGYKNTKVNFIPEHIIVRNAAQFIENPDSDSAKRLKTRMDFCLNILKAYAQCLKPIRSLDLPFDDYPYGM